MKNHNKQENNINLDIINHSNAPNPKLNLNFVILATRQTQTPHLEGF